MTIVVRQTGISASEIFTLVIAIGGNLALAGLFLNALLRPLENADFIFKTGLWLFVVEFLSVFGIAGLQEEWQGMPRKAFAAQVVVFFFAIGIFAFAFGYAILGNLYLPAIFLGSMIAKSLGGWVSHSSRKSQWVLYTVLILFSINIVFGILTPERLVQWFPFPEEMFFHKDPQSSGEFVDRPQTLLVWGIIHYTLAALLEIALFFKLPTAILNFLAIKRT